MRLVRARALSLPMFGKMCPCRRAISKLSNIAHGHADMSQFGLGSANSHWGYSSSGYSPYLTGNGLTSCATPTAAQFNNPALGFTCSSTDQPNGQDFGAGGVGAGSGGGVAGTGASAGNGRDCVPSKLAFGMWEGWFGCQIMVWQYFQNGIKIRNPFFSDTIFLIHVVSKDFSNKLCKYISCDDINMLFIFVCQSIKPI